MNLFRALAVALSMYSKIPVPAVKWEEKNMKYAMCFFPVVGVVIGLLQLLASCVMGEAAHCGTILYAAVMTLIPVAVTGGIHLDGFADTTDALCSYGDREKKLKILKDPNTGAFAVIGLCSYFLAVFALWSEMPERVVPVTACIYVLSRSLSGISVVTFQAAKESGLLKSFQDAAQETGTRIVLAVWAGAAILSMLCLSWKEGAAAALAALLSFLYYKRMSREKFGGTTGDLAGYFLQVCELAMLAAIVLAGLAA